ncbi:threonylcarbamoyl-AMP synthase [Candidatus Saccharibacteria bacterium]|nr:threonylcarbamoyl-AMP synthase [Candidatus Saccharibacteria bacterium]
MKDQFDKLLEPGTVGVIPTDTVYGLVARAADPEAVQRLYHVKRRENKPGTIIAASVDQLVDLGLKKRYLTAVEQWWPAPLSVVIPCGPELNYLHQGKLSLAVRIPANDDLRELLARTGPLLTTSANSPGEPTATTVDEARAYLGDEVDFYKDGGNLTGHQPSTVVRIIDDAIEVLREGAVKIDESGKIES